MERIQPDDVTVRPASQRDAEALAAMLRLLSPQSSFLRFLAGLGEPKPALVRALLATGPDRGAVLAVLPGGTVVGHANWVVGATRAGAGGGSAASGVVDVGVVDVGVLVVDGWQRRGLGRALFDAAVTRAAAAGGTELHLDIHPENRRLLATLRRRLPAARRALVDGLVTVDAPLPALVGAVSAAVPSAGCRPGSAS